MTARNLRETGLAEPLGSVENRFPQRPKNSFLCVGIFGTGKSRKAVS